MSTFDAFRVLIVSPNVPSPQDGERVVFSAKSFNSLPVDKQIERCAAGARVAHGEQVTVYQATPGTWPSTSSPAVVTSSCASGIS